MFPGLKIIVRKIKIRESIYKCSAVRVLGKLIPMHKVSRFRRQNLRIAHAKSGSQSPIPSDIEIYTPPPSPLSALHSLRLAEELMKTISKHTSGAFEKKIWITTGDSSTLKPTGKGLFIFHLSDFLNSALDPFQRYESRDVDQSLIRARDKIVEVIAYQGDEMIGNLFF